MTKEIRDPVSPDALIYKLETAQLAQLSFELFRAPAHCAQQSERKLAADYRSSLKKSFCLIRQPIDA
jgi:hypothetical protein